MLWAMERHLCQSNETVRRQIRILRQDLATEFGAASSPAVGLLGPILLWSSRREETRLTDAVAYEPKTVEEHRNWPTAAF